MDLYMDLADFETMANLKLKKKCLKKTPETKICESEKIYLLD